MKRILLFICALFFLNGCFLGRIFSKKERYGCPTNGRNVGAEKIASGDEKAIKAGGKAKYKGRKSLY